MNLLINWLISALTVFAIAYILPGVGVDSFVTAIVVALVLGLINAIIKPILIFFTLPLTLITLGLFTFVIDALMVMLVARIVPGFNVDSFLWALLFALVLAVVNMVFRKK